MLILSAGARRLINDAASLLPAGARQVWQAWADGHPQVRRAGDPSDDSKGALPKDVAGVILAALEAQRERMRLLRGRPGISEDEVSDLDNDISHIGSVERAVLENIR